jgi:hypothetical protein
MNAIPVEQNNPEEAATEAVQGVEDVLVEDVGAVTDTKGGVFGYFADGGGGRQFT